MDMPTAGVSPETSPDFSMAVVIACSKLKARCPVAVASRAELRDLTRPWTRLQKWETPARDLYRGRQFMTMVRAVDAFRNARPNVATSLYVVSAGYGLVAETQGLVPYEAALGPRKKDWIRIGRELGMASHVRGAIGSASVAIVALSEPYMTAAELPADHIATRVVYLMAGKHVPISNGIAVRAGRPEARALGTTEREVRGVILRRLLGLLAERGLSALGTLGDDPLSWPEVVE